MREGNLSIVLPAYNEGKMVCKAQQVLSELLKEENIEYELIFVDDGSKDNTWNEIENTSELDPNVVVVHFSRNFGKEAAIYAGLGQATGQVSAVMDCDL